MEYEEIRPIKQSEKSAVSLVRKQGETRLTIRKVLAGQHSVYNKLQECPHPYLPKIYEVNLSDDTTTVIEEYIEGGSPAWQNVRILIRTSVIGLSGRWNALFFWPRRTILCVAAVAVR